MQNTRIQMKAFTLIELLIVIAIIGILAVSLLPSILDAPKAARDAGKKAKLNDLVVAIEQYKATGGQLPGTNGNGECMPSSPATGAYANIAALFKGGALSVEAPQEFGPVGGPLTTGCPFTYYQVDKDDPTENDLAKGASFVVCVALEGRAMGNNFYNVTSAPTALPAIAGTPTNAYCVAN